MSDLPREDLVRHIRVHVEDQSAHKQPDYGFVEEKLEVLIQLDERVIACEHPLLVKRSE